MKFFSLEKRPVNPKAVYAACMIGLSIAIPALIVAPKVIEAHQGTQFMPGQRCEYQGEKWSIVDYEGDTLKIVNYRTLEKAEIPKSEARRILDDVAPEYHWYLSLIQ